MSGGKYRSYEGCKPYPIQPNPALDKPTHTQCFDTCDSSYTKNSYANDKIKGIDTAVFSYDNKEVMDEIMTNGPVITEFELYEDFFNYSSGVYQHKTGKLYGYYYAKIIGWGVTDDTVSFWRAAASFGKNWGTSYKK